MGNSKMDSAETFYQQALNTKTGSEYTVNLVQACDLEHPEAIQRFMNDREEVRTIFYNQATLEILETRRSYLYSKIVLALIYFEINPLVALSLIEEITNDGGPIALYIIGLCRCHKDFNYGTHEITDNFKVGILYIQKAVDNGFNHAEAYRIIGAYELMTGDKKKGKELVKCAYNMGNKDAAYNIANMYKLGDAAKPNFDKAINYFLIALDSSQRTYAINNLGFIYNKLSMWNESLFWFKLNVKEGYTPDYYNLAISYRAIHNQIKAAKYFYLAEKYQDVQELLTLAGIGQDNFNYRQLGKTLAIIDLTKVYQTIPPLLAEFKSTMNNFITKRVTLFNIWNCKNTILSSLPVELIKLICKLICLTLD